MTETKTKSKPKAKKKETSLVFDLKQFSKDILAKRTKDDLSFRDIETSTGINKATIHRIETGDTVPGVTVYGHIVAWLKKNPADYFIKK